MKKKLSDIELHSAGATIRHKSIFDGLPTYENSKEIDQEFRDKWVIPYYFNLNKNDDEWINKMIAVKDEINENIILQNLGDFNWRTRSTGAFFAAIKDKQELTDIIGNHLLKSEVCFAGRQYAVTLTSFNSELSIYYLNKYLEYYLHQLELEFDQIAVARAIKYLDEINGTDYFKNHQLNLKTFKKHRAKQAEITINKFYKEGAIKMATVFEDFRNFWKEELSTEPIRKSIKTINKIKYGSK